MVLFVCGLFYCVFFFFKQKTAYEMRISDWSSDVCSSDLDLELREILVRRCAKAKLQIVPVLDPIMHAFGKYLGEKAQNLPGRQHELDAEYFYRIDAMHFTIAHAYGQHLSDIDKPHIVLLGCTRHTNPPTPHHLPTPRHQQ